MFEVVVAVGIFIAAMTVMVGLMPALARQSGRVSDTQAALRLPDAVRVELTRVAIAGGFDVLAAQTQVLSAPMPDTLKLVATRNALMVQALDYQPPPADRRMSVDEQYFLIETWRFSDAPLAFDGAGAALLLHVRVSWPYHLPNSATITSLADREQVTFNLSIRR